MVDRGRPVRLNACNKKEGSAMRFTRYILALLAVAAMASAAHAEFEIKAYGGMNENFDSNVKTQQGATSDSRDVSWDGKSFEMPPYWGVRGTYWMETDWGVAIDFAHTKAYGEVDFGTDPVYDVLEFTDGANTLTANVLYRWQDKQSSWVPYVGGGVGIGIPHVEVTLDGGTETFEYQIAGPVGQVLVGTDYNLTESWKLFAEAKLSYMYIHADLDGGGSTETQLWQPQLALGLGYSF